MDKKRLQIEHLDRKLKAFEKASQVAPPPTGWLKAVRVSLGITLQQLSDKLSIAKPSLHNIEKREQEGGISLRTLRDVANALDMQLVYGFVPNDGSLDNLINRKAEELARRIVMRTSNTMKLEDQQNSEERIAKAIKERTAVIKGEMPKMLWD